MHRIMMPFVVVVASSAAVVAQTPPTVTTVEAFGDLTNPIGITSARDGSGRLFVIQQGGQIRVWTGTEVLETPFLDLDPLTNGGGERGLLGLAFHPSYASNGFFFVNYTDLSGDTVVARYQASPPSSNVADGGSALRILGFDQPASNHNGGDMHFGPDGFLYIASGDGGAGALVAQDQTNLLGKILRIDVDGDDFPGDANRNYAIPADNPLVGVAGAAEEIFVLGLRNPWRFSFDRSNGDLFIGDVGEGTREEISYLPAASAGGVNLGWPCWEGTVEGVTGGVCDTGTFVDPIFELPHDLSPNNNCSIIGGFRYHGPYPSLRGWYIFSDWCTGQIWAGIESTALTARPVPKDWKPMALGSNGWSGFHVNTMPTFTLTGWGEADDGDIFGAASWRGVVRLVDPNGDIFADGFESGDTSEWVVGP